MLRSLFGKTLRDRRRSLLWWTVGILAYMVLLEVAYPALADQREALQALVESYPESLLAALGVAPGQDVFSPAGYVASQATALIVPLAFSLLAAAFGARAVAGEEEEGTMDLLLAAPISRTRVILEKAAAMAAVMGWLSVVLFASIWLGRFFEMEIAAANIAGTSAAAGLLALAFGSVALAAGAVSGRRGVTVGVVSFLAVGSFLLNALGQVLPELEGWRLLSPFYYYDSSQPLVSGYDWGHGAVLAVVALAGLAVGVWGFNRRDVGTA